MSSESSASTPTLDSQLCFALYTASHRMTRAYRPVLDALGVTFVQYLVLLVLWEEQPRSVGELGESLFLDSGTLTPLLKRMERAGLVSRRRDLDDERRVLIELTPQGRELKSHAPRINHEILCQLDMSPREVSHLRDQILGVVRKLDQCASN